MEQPKDLLTPESFYTHGQQPLPNATSSMVLGILSLVFCIFYGVLAVVLGGIGFYLAQQDRKLLAINPELYTAQSIGNHRAGRVCSLIGLIMGGLFIIIAVLAFTIFMGGWLV